MSKRFWIVLCAAVLIIIATPLFAQSGMGNAEGIVKDTSGAVIPGAAITITHVETGTVITTVANGAGYFSTPPVKIGRHKARIEMAGMRPWEADLEIETGRTTAIAPVLTVGQVTETVTVEEKIPLVTTTEPTEGSTLDARRIKELPVDGRDMNTLISDVTPGVEQRLGVNGGVRVGGMMEYATNYVQDGAAANNRETGGSMNLQGLESVGEVRVETSTSSARYNSATSVIVTTKSGTNRIRGAVYETARNNGFGVARARQDVFYDGTPYKVPKLIRNEFGGSIGGPVFLPSFGLNGKNLYDGRNRTFFFFSREGTELRQGVTREFKTPTAAMRRGDFSELRDGQGRFIQLYDPRTTRQIKAPNGRLVTTRDPFANNQIPVELQSPLAKRIWDLTPLPTDITNPLVTNNLKMVVATNLYPNVSNDPTTVRLDHRFNDSDNFFIKFNGSHRSTDFLGTSSSPLTGAPTANNEANVTYLPMEALAGSLSWVHLFSPTFFVETSVNRIAQTTQTVTGPTQKNWAEELGLPNPYGETGFPNITNVGFMNYIEGDQRRSLRTLVSNAEQNYTLIRNRHNFQFGWRFHHEKQTSLPDQQAISGSAYFDSLATAVESSTSGSTTSPSAQPQTGYAAANFFLGYAARYDVGLKRGLMHITERNYGFHLQDTYRITSRLTLTPGLRWDINPALTDEDKVLNVFDVPSHSVMLPEALDYYYKIGATNPQVVQTYDSVGIRFTSAAELGKSKQIFQSNYFDIAPRIGFAYTAFSGKKSMVIRGGYGMYLVPMPMRTLLWQFANMVPFRATYSYQPNTAAQSPDGNSNWLLRNPQDYVAGVNSAGAVDFNKPNTVARGRSVVGMGELPSMKLHEWNLTLEKQIGGSTAIRLSYNGKHGVHADQLNNINPTQTNYVWYTTTGLSLPTGPFASVARRPYDQNAYTDVQILEKTGYINSSSFTAELQRRFSNGMGFQVFHTVTNVLRAAGNSSRDSLGTVVDAYIPGTVPTDPEELNRFLNYKRDTAVPKHRTRWNYNYELPFGRNKLIGRNAPGWLNAIAGGWTLSGSGTLVSTWFSLPTNNWGATNGFEVYGKKYPILDCRDTPATASRPQDERCFPGYLYFNGYVSNRFINSYNAAGLRNGVFGLPDDYQPVQSPVNPWPKGGQPGQPGSNDWDTDVVYLTLKNGAVQRVETDTGLHPFRQQYRLGPINWLTDASLMKFFNIGERMRLRVNADMFNVFNNQGLNTPGADGIVTLESSYGGFGFRPRQLQLTMRLEW